MYRIVIAASCILAACCPRSSAGEPSRTFDIDLRSAASTGGMTHTQFHEKLSVLFVGRDVGWQDTQFLPLAPAVWAGYEAIKRERDSQVSKSVAGVLESDGDLVTLQKHAQDSKARLQMLEAVPKPSKPVRDEFESKEDYAERLRAYESQLSAYRPTEEAIRSTYNDLKTTMEAHAKLHREIKSAASVSVQEKQLKDTLRLVFPTSLSKYDIDNNSFDVSPQIIGMSGHGGKRRAPGMVDYLNSPFTKWVEDGNEGAPNIFVCYSGKLREAAEATWRINGFRDVDEAKSFKELALKGGLSCVVEVRHQPEVRRQELPGGKRQENELGIHGENKPSTIRWELKLAREDEETGPANVALIGPAFANAPHLTVSRTAGGR